jgi:alpha-N-arabinofuranosidase
LEAISVYNEEESQITVFAVNRHLNDTLDLDVNLRSFGKVRVLEHLVLEHDNIKASNTKSHPENVMPHNRGTARAEDGHVHARLSKTSWNVIRLEVIPAT